MIQVASSVQGAVPQTLQNILQPDEQPLWWERPQLKKMRSPLTSRDAFSALLSGVVCVLFLLILACVETSISLQTLLTLPVLIGSIVAFFAICAASYFRLFLRTFVAASKKAPSYLQYTLYAVTDRRALIIVSLPASDPVVFEYLPHEINLSPGFVRPNGSGILPFSTSRQSTLGKYSLPLVLPGSFSGISHVQNVTTLLQQLKSR
jgi:hypothetical protein